MCLNGRYVHFKLMTWCCAGSNEQNALSLISIECSIPTNHFSEEIKQHVRQEFSERDTIPDAVMDKRLDFRDTSTFTIGDDSTSCINFALSFDMVKAGQFLLGVHVADVTHHVKKGKPLDVEASERGQSVSDN